MHRVSSVLSRQPACSSWHLDANFFVLFLKTASVSQIHKGLHWRWLNKTSLVSTPNMYNVNLVNLDVSLKEKLAHLNC